MFGFKHKLARVGARAGLLAGASAAVLAVSGIGASSAFAEGVCTGSDIAGEGASLQKVAQIIWTGTPFVASKGFNGNAKGCTKKEEGGIKKPMVTYNPSGTGAGLEAWGNNGHAFTATDVFISADDAPNGPVATAGTQLNTLRKTLREKGAEANETDLAVIPVTQTAVAVIVNLPAECSLTQITNANLEAAFRGSKTKWSEVGGTGAGCTTAIKRVVRKDGSGTTYQFKHYLSVINTGKVCTTALGEQTWTQLQNNSKVGEVLPNTTWPDCEGTSEIVRPAGTGGGELVKKVNTTDSSIGYAALPDVKANPPKTEEGQQQAILKVQDGTVLGSPVFAAPDVAAESLANCGEVPYNFPLNEAGTEEVKSWEAAGAKNLDWSKVYGSNPTILGGKYPICTLTWSVAATDSTKVFGANAKTTVKDYLSYVVAAEGGQADLAGNWYRALPAGPAEAAAVAVGLIK